MRSHLLHNQNGKPIQDLVFFRHGIGRRVCSNGKLSEGKIFVLVHNHLNHQIMAVGNCFFSFLWGAEIRKSFHKIVAGRRNHTSVLKLHRQIFKLNPPDIYTAHIQNSIGPAKPWRREYLSHGNVHIGNTVFKFGLGRRIRKLHKIYPHIGAVTALPQNLHVLCLIQRVNKSLLDFLVLFIIQSINLNGLLKNLLKIRTNVRNWKGDNCKAGFIAGNILVCHRHGHIFIFQIQLLLFFGKGPGLFFVDRGKSFFAKYLYNRRSRIGGSLFFILLISGFKNRKLPVAERFVKIHRAVVTPVIVVLLIGGGRGVSAASGRGFVYAAYGAAGKDHRQAAALKNFNRFPHHALES